MKRKIIFFCIVIVIIVMLIPKRVQNGYKAIFYHIYEEYPPAANGNKCILIEVLGIEIFNNLIN